MLPDVEQVPGRLMMGCLLWGQAPASSGVCGSGYSLPFMERGHRELSGLSVASSSSLGIGGPEVKVKRTQGKRL